MAGRRREGQPRSSRQKVQMIKECLQLGEGRQQAAGAALAHAGTELGLKALQPGQRKEKECHHRLCLHHFLSISRSSKGFTILGPSTGGGHCDRRRG